MTPLPMRVIRAMAALLASLALVSRGGGGDDTLSDGNSASTGTEVLALTSTAAGGGDVDTGRR